MASTKKLNKAKSAKIDEFYTQHDTIEKEIIPYFEYDNNIFREKIIYCPCDNPKYSMFVKFFKDNFDKFGLKKLISTYYNPNSYSNTAIPLILGDSIEKVKKLEYYGDREVISYLKYNGDFRSKEVSNIRDEADIIITNPPFSLFREFVKWIMDAGKQFIILGNVNAISYKDIFSLIKDNKLWLGHSISSGDVEFKLPKGNADKKSNSYRVDYLGNEYIKVSGIRWYTNILHNKRNKFIKCSSEKHDRFLKYDNFDGIEIPSVNSIPSDYYGMMGVPITFLDKYNPNQFEIIGIDRYTEGNRTPNKRFTINGKELYARIVIRHKKT